ncbi:MAG: hypothetical protein LBT50_05005 [Prevotellaceae bacterium]|jgi:hypothetical protein|nr:hypothetical protein [Prevotellaceae bacterium]
MKHIFVIILLIYAISLSGQEIATNTVEEKIYSQLNSFPQEKIHVHTDKSAYVAGEKIWYRIFVVNALLHTPSRASRYVYVELVSPAGELVGRDKIRPDSDSLFHNNIVLPEDLAEGTYLIRAYTNFMRNRPEYFFEKRVFIADPRIWSVHVNPEFSIEKEKALVKANFFDEAKNPVNVENINIRVDDGKMKKIDAGENFAFNIIAGKQQSIYMEFENEGQKHRKYIPAPFAANDFDVSFFPEGGYIVDENHCNIGFKAIKTDGLSEDITGDIFDDNNVRIMSIESGHAGMGLFSLFVEKGRKYHAVVKNKKGKEKRIQLPVSKSGACVLKTRWNRNQLYVTLLKDPEFVERSLNIVIHVRGAVIYSGRWPEKNLLSIEKNIIPSGVVQILLMDENSLLSERLVFNYNHNELVKASMLSEKSQTGQREHFHTLLRVTDAFDNPLEGNFSVSVMSNDNFLPDSSFSIVSNLLLCSDLRGYIESPEHYLDNPQAADALMLTQGWKRYDIPLVLKDSIETPVHFMEAGQEISGKVERVIGSKANENSPISLIVPDSGYVNSTTTDSNGRFVFNGFEYPDSTMYIIQALSKKGGRYVELVLDEETFPETAAFAVPEYNPDSLFRRYMRKSVENKVEDSEFGILLDSVVIRQTKQKSKYSTVWNTNISLDEHRDIPGLDITRALRLFPKVSVRNNEAYIGSSSVPAMFVIDDWIWYEANVSDLDIDINDIERIEVLEGKDATFNFPEIGSEGAIIILTKSKTFLSGRKIKLNIKAIKPKGYRRPAEFYIPKYETVNDKKSATRNATVFWKPNIILKNGNAEFDFFTFDSAVHSVIIEGVTKNGQIIRKMEKIGKR